MKKIVALSVAILGSYAVVACADDHDSGASGCPGAGVNSTAGAQTVVDGCSAALTCVVDGESTSRTLEQHDGACYVGSFRLDDDGTAVGGTVTVDWQATRSTLDLCVDGDCIIKCRTSSSAAPPSSTSTSSSATPAPQANCTGQVKSCDLLGFSDCINQDGCETYEGYGWDGGPATLCRGIAKPCSFMVGKYQCEEQVGCRYE